MVAQERDHRTSLAQGAYLVKNAFAAGASVDVIAEEDQRVLQCRLDGLDYRDKGLRAAVNVADCDDAVGHGRPPVALSHASTRWARRRVPLLCRKN
jgi:hypothetical protein